MSETTHALTLQMLDWISLRPRDYVEVMEAWRTSCPRLSIWEDACIDGLVICDPATRKVWVTAKGRALLSRREPPFERHASHEGRHP